MIEYAGSRCLTLFWAILLLFPLPCLGGFGQQLLDDPGIVGPVIPGGLSTDDAEQGAEPQPTLEAVLHQLRQAETRIAELEFLTATIDRRLPNEPDVIDDAKPLGIDNYSVEPRPDSESSARSTRTFYSSDGFGIETEDNRFSVAIQNRIQARYSNPFDGDPRTLSALQQNESSFMVRRARTKVRGSAYHPWLEFYLQYDWADPILRDLSLTISKYKWATLEIGRTKVLYNDERKTSSANQQLVNRSIVNDIFTVDRQQGVQLYGNVLAETPIDTTYYLGVFTGRGVGVRNNDDDHLMYNARLQWNAFGGEIPFSQSDVEYSPRPALNFAVAANTNRSSCLAFETSQNSCRPLPWAPYDTIGEPGQYRINQMMGEVRFKWVGFSLLHELHVKEINDRFAGDSDPFKQTTMLGGFIQAGYFPHTDIPVIPKEVEIAGRYAMVDPRLAINNVRQYESSGVVTYFLNGHRNKINVQLSQLTLTPDNISSRTQQRLWVQWDLSF